MKGTSCVVVVVVVVVVDVLVCFCTKITQEERSVSSSAAEEVKIKTSLFVDDFFSIFCWFFVVFVN